MKLFSQKGVSIIEILIVIAILVLLLSLILPSFSAFRDRQILKNTTEEVLSFLNKAKSQSIASLDSSEYGVYFESGRIVLFKGIIYVEGDLNNEEFILPDGVAISNISLTSGSSFVYFNKLTGTPSKTGSITISTSSSLIVSIGATGSISVN